MRDQAAEATAGFPLVGRQAQVTAGHVLVVALFRGLGGLHTLGDRAAVRFPGHRHVTGVEVADETHQCGFVGSELLRGRWEQNDQGRGLGLTCVDRGENVRQKGEGVGPAPTNLQPL